MAQATMPGTRAVDIAELIDRQQVGRFQIWVLVMCASAMFVDGFDTQAIGYVAPRLMSALALKPGALGFVFAAGGLGALLGTLAVAPFADRIGRKPAIIGSMLFFALSSFLTATANTASQLAWLRFATGLGLGGVVPNALALTAEFMPKYIRVTLVLIAWLGFSVGSGTAGPITAHLLQVHSWRSIFVFGGLLPVILVPILMWRLPESLHTLTRRGASSRRIGATLIRMGHITFPESTRFTISEKEEKGFPVAMLFREGRAGITILLWVMFFMNLLALFFLSSWLPTILHKTGIPEHQAINIAALLHLGGIAGGLAMGPLCDKFNPFGVLAVAYALSGTCIVGVGVAGSLVILAMITTFCAGFFTFGAQNTANAIAATKYPTAMRSTGIGWALGVGRSAQIVGPIIGGLLLSAQWQTRGILSVIAIPAVIAASAAFVLRGSLLRFGSRREATTT